MDDKLNQLMRKELKTSLPPIMTNTPMIHVGVPVPQIQSQPNLVIHPTTVNQHLGWQQLITPLIARNPKVVPYAMWYNILTFIPMDPNMYFMYYFRIKRFDPLIYRRKERYVADITKAKLVPPIEQLE